MLLFVGLRSRNDCKLLEELKLGPRSAVLVCPVVFCLSLAGWLGGWLRLAQACSDLLRLALAWLLGCSVARRLGCSVACFDLVGRLVGWLLCCLGRSEVSGAHDGHLCPGARGER